MQKRTYTKKTRSQVVSEKMSSFIQWMETQQAKKMWESRKGQASTAWIFCEWEKLNELNH